MELVVVAHGWEAEMEFAWEEDFALEARIEGKAVVICANRAGLVSLSKHLLALACEPVGSHFHLDEHNSLEEGSCELIVEHADDGTMGTAPSQSDETRSSLLDHG